MTAALPGHVLVFSLGEQRLAIGLESVTQVVRAVEISPLPSAPPHILGVINVHGRIIPVMSLKERLGLAAREIELNDQILIVHTGEQELALVIDRADEVVQLDWQMITTADRLGVSSGPLRGIARLSNDMVLIEDVEEFLSAREGQRLAAAMSR
jgi:purine-binding chemotaxis protein CheW